MTFSDFNTAFALTFAINLAYLGLHTWIERPFGALEEETKRVEKIRNEATRQHRQMVLDQANTVLFDAGRSKMSLRRAVDRLWYFVLFAAIASAGFTLLGIVDSSLSAPGKSIYWILGILVVPAFGSTLMLRLWPRFAIRKLKSGILALERIRQ